MLVKNRAAPQQLKTVLPDWTHRGRAQFGYGGQRRNNEPEKCKYSHFARVIGTPEPVKGKTRLPNQPLTLISGVGQLLVIIEIFFFETEKFSITSIHYL